VSVFCCFISQLQIGDNAGELRLSYVWETVGENCASVARSMNSPGTGQRTVTTGKITANMAQSSGSSPAGVWLTSLMDLLLRTMIGWGPNAPIGFFTAWRTCNANVWRGISYGPVSVCLS